MGLVYAGYEFIWIYIGGFTSVSDVTVFNSSELKNVIESQNIGFPEAVLFPCDDRNIPCFLIGDNASPLRTCLWNHRFSRRYLTNESTIDSVEQA